MRFASAARKERIRLAATRLWGEFCGRPWFVATAIDYPFCTTLLLYVTSRRSAEVRSLPKTYRGFPLAVKVSGRPVPLSLAHG